MLAETLSPAPEEPLPRGRLSVRAERRSGAERLPVAALQARIRGMQATTLESKSLPTAAGIASLLPGGSLKEGAAYSVAGSTSLAMALLSGPSAAGAWCAVVGVPDFGAEAASRFGIELDRLALVPEPGEQWLAVTAALVDVMGAVLVRPPKRASDADVARLSARLRQRGAALIVLGEWPQSEATLELHDNRWRGLGAGSGHLLGREATVSVIARSGAGRARTARLSLPETETTAGTEAPPSSPQALAAPQLDQRMPRRMLRAAG